MANFIYLPGLTNYQDAVTMMEKKILEVELDPQSEVVYLLEHDHVYTAGSSACNKELLLINEEVPTYQSNRGGKWTYHGPGQRVIYPILNLASTHHQKDIKCYIDMLEQWIINCLDRINVKAFANHKQRGVWVEENGHKAKIASIGIKIRRWVTYHGIAINIETDLSKFAGIIACGIENLRITSLKAMGVKIALQEFDHLLTQEFTHVFGKMP